MTKQPTWNDILKLAYLGSKDKSLGQRAEVLTALIGSKTYVKRINNDLIMSLITSLKARGISDSTLNRYLSIISKVVSVYRRSYDPTFAVHIPWHKEGSGRFAWLTQEEEAKVLKHLSPELALIVTVLTTTGMRMGELLSLEPTQIEEGWIRLWKTKTNRPRSVPIEASTAYELRQLVTKGLPGYHQIRRGLSGALKASGVNSSITPHSLRHTTATRLIKSGVNLMVTQKYLGHNSIKTTQRYVHIDDGDISDALVQMTGSR